jgi:hypothetical protein
VSILSLAVRKNLKVADQDIIWKVAAKHRLLLIDQVSSSTHCTAKEKGLDFRASEKNSALDAMVVFSAQTPDYSVQNGALELPLRSTPIRKQLGATNPRCTQRYSKTYSLSETSSVIAKRHSLLIFLKDRIGLVSCCSDISRPPIMSSSNGNVLEHQILSKRVTSW